MMVLRSLSASALALAVLALLGSFSGCSESTPKHSASTVDIGVDIFDLQKAGLKHRWSHTVGMADGESARNVWRVGDAVYVATDRSQLISINASTGTRNWNLDMGSSSHEIFRPVDVPNTNIVIVANQGAIGAVDKRNGRFTKLMRPLGFSATTDPFVVDNTLCIGGPNYFYGLYLDPFGGRRWVVENNGDYFISRPTLLGKSNLVIAGALTGKIWKISPSNGDWEWRDRKVNGKALAPLGVDGRNVYVPSMEGRLYAFDVNTGSYQWDTRLEGKLNLGPVSANPSTILCPSGGEGLYALSTNKGEIKWLVPEATQIGTITANKIFAGDGGGSLFAIQIDSGEVVARLPVPGLLTVAANNVDGIIYVATRSGRVIAMDAIK